MAAKQTPLKRALAIIEDRARVSFESERRYKKRFVAGEVNESAFLTERAAKNEARRIARITASTKDVGVIIELAAQRGRSLMEQGDNHLEAGERLLGACYRCAGMEARHISELLSKMVAA